MFESMHSSSLGIARRGRSGFSLVELMIVVAIIGILAAIAVPNYMVLQLRAKQAELPANMDAIKASEMAYDAAYDGFVPCPLAPRGDPDLDGRAVEFVAPAGYTDGWSAIGWIPDGLVRGNYEVVPSVDMLDYEITGKSDLDDDDISSTWTASKLQNPVLGPFDADTF